MSTVNIGILEAIAIIRNEISGPVSTMRKDIDDFAKSSADNFKVLGQAAGIVTGALTAVAGGIVALGMRGADVSDIRGEFDGLTSSVGLSADALSSRLTAATDGIISKFDLMQTANKALSGGLRISVDDFGTLGEAARVLADRVGGDAKETFDALTEAMTNGKIKGLKPYGVDIVELNQKIQDAGKGLTEYQKLHVIQTGLLDQLSRATQESGDKQLDFADKIARGATTLRDLTDDVAIAIANNPALAVVMDTIGDAIQNAFGGDQQSRVAVINEYVSKFAIVAVDAASVILEFGRFAVNAFYGARVGLFGLLEGLFDTEVQLRELQIATLEYANTIPGLRGNFDGLLESARSSQQVSAAIRDSFKETKDAALDSAAGINAGFDSTQGTLAKMREGMVEASKVTQETTRTTRALRGATDEHAVSEKERTEAMKKAAQEMAKLHSELQQLGIVTETMVNAKLAEFNTLLEQAFLEGADYTRVVSALYPELKKLADQAKNSGIQVAGLDEAMKSFNETVNASVDAGFEKSLNLSADALFMMQAGYKQVDFAAIQHRISTDQLTAAYKTFGMSTPAELRKVAAESKRNYDVLVSSGMASTAQLKDAYRQMIDAQKAATGELPGFWDTKVVPGIKSALENLQTAVAGSFAQMSMGAKSFSEGFEDIWKSIKASAINIFNDIAEAFINGALKRMIGALSGSNNSFLSGLGNLLGGKSGGSGISGLLGGGTAATAANGFGGAASSSSVAAAGMGLGGGGGAAGAGGVAGTGISSAVIGAAVGAAGAAVAGVGLGVLGKKLFGGAGLAAGGFGAATGAASGAAIGSVVPGLGTAVGAIIGGVAGGLSGMLGVSKTEKQGRSAVAEIEANLAASLSAQQQIEAGGEGWKMTVIAVRDAFLATGRSSEEAEAAVKKLWASSKGGAKAVEAAVAPIQAAFDEMAAKQAEAAAAIEAGTTDSTEAVDKATDASDELRAAWERGIGKGEELGAVSVTFEEMEQRIHAAAQEADRLSTILGNMPTPNLPGLNNFDLPMAAEGGLTTGPTIAGEAGPEMIIPLDRLAEFNGGNGMSYLELRDMNSNLKKVLAQQPALIAKALRDAMRGAAVGRG